MPTLNEVLAIILGGGTGKRLYPLTKQRAKPAVPIAGKYRLIDVPISNCINSGLKRIAVLTQYNSVSLHRHITQTYTFDDFHTGWVQILAAEQTPLSLDWYQGTADAVRKQMFEIRSTRAKYVLILAGDHLYRMDYAAMAQFHWDHKADITVAAQPVTEKEATRLGLLKSNKEGRIEAFIEKTSDQETLSQFACRDDPERPFIASMGIYLFNIEALIEILDSTPYQDFGSQIIPNSLGSHAVYNFGFDGYWKDIGTIRSFYDVSLALTLPEAQFSFYDPERPIYTRSRYLPGSVIGGAQMENVLLADGCQILQARITQSIVGLRSQIGDGVIVKDSIVMGADFYDAPESPIPSGIPLGIGKNCMIEGAIIDKNVRMGEGTIIRPFPSGTAINTENWVVQDGIVVIPKSTILSPGTIIAPD